MRGWPPHVHKKVMGRKRQGRSLTAPSPLEGALLITKKSFPYFMLVAIEAGRPLRAIVLLLISPILKLLKLILCEHIAFQAMIFVSTVQSRGTTLSMFFLEDSRESTWRVLSRYRGKKYALTCIPRIMVEPFLKDHLGVDHVISIKLRARSGYSMGLVSRLGIMVGMLDLGASRDVMIMSTRDGINHEEEEKEIDVW